jgi:hypothetical protein
MNQTRALSLVAVLATSLFLAACGATGSVDAEVDIPLPGGGSVGVGVRVSNDGDKVADLSGTPVCVKVCYRGADGRDLGCSTIEVPGSDQVPAGAVSWSATLVDCPTGGSGGGGRMLDPFTQAPQQQLTALPKRPFVMFGGNLVPDIQGENVIYSFGIVALDLQAAQARRDYVLAGGIGTDVGQGFELAMWSESKTEFDLLGVPTGVRTLQAVVDDDFATYELTINDTLFADLNTGNALHYGMGNGWNVVETFVPVSAFDTGAIYDNKAESTWTTWGSPRIWYAMQNVWN